MCTLSFIPKSDGCLLAMNRDDLYSRAATREPVLCMAGRRIAMYPAEFSGGTWIGANDFGLVLAILNWDRPAGEKLRSRGQLIPELLAAESLDDAEQMLSDISLAGVRPFRLVGFSLARRDIREWRWDGRLEAHHLLWEPRHWFSSGVSDHAAAAERGALCRQALTEPDARSLDWLRRLHRSHGKEPGPFTVCAHRENAGTLSYSEIVIDGADLVMRYSPESPCKNGPLQTNIISLQARCCSSPLV